MSHCCGRCFLLASLLDGCEELFLQWRPSGRSVYATTLVYSYLDHQLFRLYRALYGLKHAPRVWFEKFSSIVAQEGFTLSPHETAFFIHRSSAGITLILHHVDDMIIIGDDSIGI